MSNVIDMQSYLLAQAYDPDECREGIPAHVVISAPGQGITTSGAGEVDVYPGGNFVGLTVTASTGLALFVSIPADQAVSMLEWALRRVAGCS